MHAEQLEIAGFLEKHPPFDELSQEALQELAQQVEVAYYRSGNDILNFAEPLQDLYVIRRGAVETYRRTGELYSRLSDGDVFGQMGLLMNQRVRFPVKAIEDTLVYCIPFEQFRDYCDRYETFADYFESENDSSSLLRKAISAQHDNNDLTTVKVKGLMPRELVTISNQASIREAAEVMTANHVSSVLVLNQTQREAEDPGLVGIITDRDLRGRVLACGVDPASSVDQIMSKQIITLDDNAYVFEAMLLMLRNNIHHLPIVQRQKPVGVLALSDLMRHESQSSILLVRSIFKLSSVEELKAHAKQLPAVFVRMVKEDANSHMIGSAMAVIGRSFKQRLLELAEERFGPPPVDYCFLALGSMARDEQLIYTDQDNAMVLDDSYREKEHGDYFAQVAKYVSDGLAECGYTYCDGEVMATNPEWRKTLSGWKRHFSDWIDEASPQALLNSNIFFDLDGVWGRTGWATELRRFITHMSKNNRKFLASMARNALNRTPPLGFFKEFVLEKDGQHKDSMNLKRRGTAPLSDVIRVHALAVGSMSVNSFERLDDVTETGLLPAGKATDLSDALEYISIVRIRHQAKQIESGETVDNNVHPKHLTSFDRRNLKEAFQVVSSAQSFLKYRYNSNIPMK
ncbi:putative nucleotidyltransferase substrate binding domain-containing protein [Sedimenticola sp.]|uniref:putative nucleotidyltransferase substrate binding domain-containing protein n=1 Tax=Sedimenticola sp. TaxID=1940285 RepID=UPI003D0EDD70